MSLRPAALAAAVACAAIVAYAPAVRCAWVWDDHHAIEHGRLIGSLANLPQLFRHDTMYNSDGGAYAKVAPVDTYRPLTMATFFVERALWGGWAPGFHLGSVLLHAVVALLLLAVALRLGYAPVGAAIGALLFALHPTLSEAVYWVSGRGDPLSVGLLLGALWLWLGGGALTATRGSAVALLVLAATLAKETAFVLLPGLGMLAWGSFRRSRRGLLAWGPFVVGALLGLGARLAALGRFAAVSGQSHLGHAAARWPALWLDGVIALLRPRAQVQLSLGEGYRAVALGRSLVGAAVVLSLLGLGLWRWRRDRPATLAAVVTLVVTLAPVGLLLGYPAWTGWGRYLYAAGAFLGFAVAGEMDLLVRRWRWDRRLAWALGIGGLAWLLLQGGRTFAAGAKWRSDRTLAEAQIADHPESAVGYSELAGVALNEGQTTAALALAQQAVAKDPTLALARSRAAVALLVLGRRPEAVAAARQALTLEPTNYNARYIDGVDLLDRARELEAAARWIELLDEQPYQEPAWQVVTGGLTRLGRGSRFAEGLRRAATSGEHPLIAARLLKLLAPPGETKP